MPHAGWREHASTALDGNLIGFRVRQGDTFTGAEVAALCATRAKVFAGYGNGRVESAARS